MQQRLRTADVGKNTEDCRDAGRRLSFQKRSRWVTANPDRALPPNMRQLRCLWRPEGGPRLPERPEPKCNNRRPALVKMFAGFVTAAPIRRETYPHCPSSFAD